MHYDVIVIGAGAAGLMAASHAGKRGKKVMLIEHSKKIGEKIRISGGGRCNFTNINASHENYLCSNPHFIKSALSQYTQHDFIKLVEGYDIAYHEKTLGQLFCDGSSKQIINMLVTECENESVTIKLECSVTEIKKNTNFELSTTHGKLTCSSLIIATGGLSIPKMGATDFGYKIAKQFGIKLIDTKPALVPLTVSNDDLEFYKNLSGNSISSVVRHGKTSFKENILFTHRGLSGPAILQISSFLNQNITESISMDLSPNKNLKHLFIENKNSTTAIGNFLKEYFPKRFIENCNVINSTKKLTDHKAKDLEKIADALHNFEVDIIGTEGYAKAEVTVGGVDTNELSSKTMESKKVSGLYFIGEVVDVTGWLGGYNFQWAWSSGYVAGNAA